MQYEQEFVELLIEQFKIEYHKKDRGGIYGLTQRRLTYNSNKIEGGTLSEEHTASLFNTGSIMSDGEIIVAKDIEEATGHFAMFNHMLETLDEELSQKLIKEFHYKLKSGVFEDMANGYPIGEYKNRKNIVGIIETTLPEEVDGRMTELLEVYYKLDKPLLSDIAIFHSNYEQIHPFQDGNGRTGRMILFRECLKNRYIPIIITEDQKQEYYYALQEMQTNRNSEPLLQLFEAKQQDYFDLAKDFVIPASNKSIEMRIKEAKAVYDSRKK